jgi:uncharacterized membrane protein
MRNMGAAGPSKPYALRAAPAEAGTSPAVSLPQPPKDATWRAVAEVSDVSAVPVAPALAAAAPSSQRVVLALIEMAIAGASLLLALRFFEMRESRLDPFLAANILEPPARAQLLKQLFAAAALPIMVGSIFLARFRLRAGAWVVRAGEVASPLIVSCLVPTLLNYRQWYSQPLPYLIQLLAFVLVLERLLTRALGGYLPREAATYFLPKRPSRFARVAPLCSVLLAAAAYSAYMSHYTIMRHQMLGTAGFDLGIFDNLMMNAMHGHPFRSTVAVPFGSYLSNHAEYGIMLFVPFYAIHPSSETLLILQSVFMGFSALPLYLFASTQVPRSSAAAIACASLLYAPTHGPNFYDFHWMPVSMFFFYWMFYAIATRKHWWIAILTVVICSMREDTAFGLIAAGLFLIATGHWPRLGVVLTSVCTLWFVVVKFIIMPWAGPWWFADIYKDLMAAGESGYGSVVRTMLINPNYFLKLLVTEAKASYTLHLLAPLALLPLRHPALALLMLPGFAVTLMTTGYAPTLSISFQYTTTWIPFLFAAVAIALRLRAQRLNKGALYASLIAIWIGIACHSYVFGAILQHNTFVGGFSRVFFDMSDGERKRYADLRNVAARIPANASVAATELEIPHVSARLDAYTLKVTSGDADYLLVNRAHFDADARNHVRKAMNRRAYGLLARKGDFFLFSKGYKSTETEAALAKLGLNGIHPPP